MAPQSPIVVLGSINTDLVIRSRRLPAPGETVVGGMFFQAAGGKGANQAVAAARAAREPVTFVGAVGGDDFGREALVRFRRENLVCEYVKTIPEEPSGVALILVDEHGQNLISVAAGANAHLAPSDVEALPEAVFRDARVFLTGLETPLQTVVRGLERAKRAGLTTILNPAPAAPEVASPDVLSLVDVLTPNSGEAAILTGLRDGAVADDPSQARAAALELRTLGCRAVVVTLGPRGCLVVDEQVTHHAGRLV